MNKQKNLKIEKIYISTKVKINKHQDTVTKRCSEKQLFEGWSKYLKNDCEEVHFLVKMQAERLHRYFFQEFW